MDFPLRREPWCTSEDQPALGRDYVALPTHEDNRARVTHLASGLGAYRTGCRLGSGLELWELPSARDQSTSGQVEITASIGGTSHRLAYPTVPATADELSVHEEAWEDLVGHHVEKICRWNLVDRGTDGVVHADGRTTVPWHQFLRDYWTTDRDSHEPPLHLIVEIAKRCAPLVQDLCARPRRVLRRDRQMITLNRAQDVDDASLRWLIRQPGRTTAQRAGPQQRILAVIRQESCDTHENRVVRDFLRLCKRSCRRYLHQYRNFQDSTRLRDVRAYLRTIEALLASPAMAPVSNLVGTPTRNYVLQFEPRYAAAWNWYDRLRRQENVRDDLSHWRSRVWVEYCELALAHACEEMVKDAPAGSFWGPAVLLREAAQGSFLGRECSIGPWSPPGLDRGHVLRLWRVQHIDNPRDRQALAGPDASDLIFGTGPYFEPTAIHQALRVWCLFTPGESDEVLEARVRRASHALEQMPVNCTGLLLVPPGGSRTVLSHGKATAIRVALPASDDIGSLRDLAPTLKKLWSTR